MFNINTRLVSSINFHIYTTGSMCFLTYDIYKSMMMLVGVLFYYNVWTIISCYITRH